MENELVKYLSSFVSKERIERIEEVLKNRTRYITIVLEDIYQPHNASAVLRSCECFGIQDVHIIEKRNNFTISDGVAIGSDKWLNLYKYNNSIEVIKKLRNEGYRIIATTVNQKSEMLPDFDLKKGKSAFFFGTELTGLTEEIVHNADEFITIPMFGFTKSFNISVSVAIILSNLSIKLRTSEIAWQLNDYEIDKLKCLWLKNSISNSDILIREYYKRISKVI